VSPFRHTPNAIGLDCPWRCGRATRLPLQNRLPAKVGSAHGRLIELVPVEEPHDVITPPTTSPVIEQI